MKKILLLIILLGGNAAWADFIRDDTSGTVTDTKRHLQWQDDSNKIILGDWMKAIDICEKLEIAQYNDWRLPNINELISITDYEKTNNITVDAFNYTRSRYFWSSTTVNNSTKNAWAIDFGVGHSNTAHKSYSNYIRCVRTVK
ncbi:DUF1566 domain-containing protein [Sulfurovum riftiae]|uniref:Lcl C-terminal domain-containing protein n=1 Tax=Sulfurovum riftiae TaxID=1630136 RepID=A0A151CGM0_9BACT|nr:DUF1566 domain-containing protein [Sulfurovum riftiae]KYJ86647.1 hypothetical protein AS592_00075 [Sulfurovum riftiae]